MKNKFINLVKVNLIFILFFLFIYRVYLFKIEAFEIICDHIGQHIPFYEEFFRLLKEGNIGWSWNTFLGTNFYGSKGYYMIGDVFAYIAYLIYPLVLNDTVYVLLIITIVKQLVAANGFYLFLRKHNINYLISALFALAFACSGWVGVFMEHPVFLSFYVFIPYILLGLEKIISDKKPLLFIFSVALMISANFYLAWSFCFFLLLYWIIRYLQIYDKFILKEFLKESLKILGYFIIGVLLSAIIWVPTVYHVMHTSRIGDDINKSFFWKLEDIIQIVQNFVVPVTRYEAYIYRGNNYYIYQIGIYCGILPIISSFIFCIKERKTRIGKTFTWFIIVCLLTLISPKIGLIFHFTNSLRYTYFVMLALLIVGSFGLDLVFREEFNYKKSLITIVSILFIVLVSFGIIYPITKGYTYSEYKELKLFYISLICLVAYFLILLFIKNKKFLIGLLLIVGFSETSYQYKTQVDSMVNTLGISVINYQSYYEQAGYDLADYVKSIDDGFYRVYYDYTFYNVGMYYDIKNVVTYDSTYEYVINDFLNLIRIDTYNKWDYKLDDPTLYKLLDVKYVISSDENESNWTYYGKKIYEDGLGHSVYQMNENSYLGRTYSDFITLDENMAVSKDGSNYLFYIIDSFENKATVDVKDVSELKSKYKDSEILYLNPDYYDNNHVEFNFETETDQFLFLSIPNDKGWIIKDNGVRLESVSVNGGFIGVEIKAGLHNLELTYEVPYLKAGAYISAIGLIITLFIYKNKYLIVK